MPKLFLPESPCGRCTRLVTETIPFVFEGGERDAEVESCSFVSDQAKFQKRRHGVKVRGEIRFPWCPYLKRRGS